MQLPKASQGADAPNIEDGLTPATFLDLTIKDHEQFVGTDSYGHPDDGRRFHLLFQVLDKPGGKPLYDDGDLVQLDTMTSLKTGPASKFAKYMEVILTAAEFAAWQAEEPFDEEKVVGREVTLNIIHNKKNWPQIDDVLPAMKAAK